jgi:hypothetical protein
MAAWLFTALVIFAACAAAASLLSAGSFAAYPGSKAAARRQFRTGASCLLMLAGIFALRVAFYAVHMTVGL